MKLNKFSFIKNGSSIFQAIESLNNNKLYGLVLVVDPCVRVMLRCRLCSFVRRHTTALTAIEINNKGTRMATRVLVLTFFLDGGSSPDFEILSLFSLSALSETSLVPPPTFFFSGLGRVNVAGVAVTNVVVVDEALLVVAVFLVVYDVIDAVVDVVVVEERDVVVIVTDVNVVDVVFVLVVVVASSHVVDRCEADG